MMWYSHTMEYYLAIKRNEVLIQAVTQMNNENIVSEGIQTQKITLYDSIYMSRIGKSIKTESRLACCLWLEGVAE